MYVDNIKDSGHIRLLAQRLLQRYLETTTTSTVGTTQKDHNNVGRWQNDSTLLSSYYKVHLEYNQTDSSQHDHQLYYRPSSAIESLSSSLVHFTHYASSSQSNQSVSFESESASTTETNKATDDQPPSSLFFVLGIGIFLSALILATMVGNALVIAAILRERHLRSVGNYLVFSLAVADLMVACFVMPLGALYAVTGQWTFGAEFCDLWTVADVLCCTASILHLLAIAVVSSLTFTTHLSLS